VSKQVSGASIAEASASAAQAEAAAVEASAVGEVKSPLNRFGGRALPGMPGMLGSPAMGGFRLPGMGK